MKPFSHETLMHLGMRGYVKRVCHQCDTPSLFSLSSTDYLNVQVLAAKLM